MGKDCWVGVVETGYTLIASSKPTKLASVVANKNQEFYPREKVLKP